MKKPDWLKIPYRENTNNSFVNKLLKDLDLNTVCDEANCPNKTECFSKKTATFMISGVNCTRNCTFCNVSHGTPEMLDAGEGVRIAEAVLMMGLKHVVITSVTRDDLPDGGASHFADVIRAIRKTSPDTVIEILIPDFRSLLAVTDATPAVIGHNIETVESLYPSVRPEANYYRSLNVLSEIKRLNPDIYTKSGIMLGLGETRNEVLKTFSDLVETGCDFLTIGQYLSPSSKHYPVYEYIEPSVFTEYGEAAKKTGFRHVTSAPFVRSSYNAGEVIRNLREDLRI